MHIADGKQGVVEVARLDQRHAQFVATDADVLRQSLDRHAAAIRMQAAGIAAVEEGLAAADAEHADQQGAGGGEGKRAGEQAQSHHGLLGFGKVGSRDAVATLVRLAGCCKKVGSEGGPSSDGPGVSFRRRGTS